MSASMPALREVRFLELEGVTRFSSFCREMFRIIAGNLPIVCANALRATKVEGDIDAAVAMQFFFDILPKFPNTKKVWMPSNLSEETKTAAKQKYIQRCDCYVKKSLDRFTQNGTPSYVWAPLLAKASKKSIFVPYLGDSWKSKDYTPSILSSERTQLSCLEVKSTQVVEPPPYPPASANANMIRVVKSSRAATRNVQTRRMSLLQYYEKTGQLRKERTCC